MPLLGFGSGYPYQQLVNECYELELAGQSNLSVGTTPDGCIDARHVRRHSPTPQDYPDAGTAI